MRQSLKIQPILWLVVSVSTPTATTATNPSGDCVADDNGARAGYHSPSPTDTYLPDCQNPLQRELWRVFEQEDGTAYMIPRPDRLGVKYGLCNEEDDEAATSTGGNNFPPLQDPDLAAKALEYGLCANILSNPAQINQMDPADALQFANVFHRQLKFMTVVGNANDAAISPFAPDSDLLDACELLDDSASAAKDYCQRIADKCNAETGVCIEIEIIPSREAVSEIVPALNQLYGIPDSGTECSEEEWGTTFGCPVAGCREAPDGCDYVFDHTVINLDRDCCPELCYVVDKDGNECSFSGGNGSRALAGTTLSLVLLLVSFF